MKEQPSFKAGDLFGSDSKLGGAGANPTMVNNYKNALKTATTRALTTTAKETGVPLSEATAEAAEGKVAAPLASTAAKIAGSSFGDSIIEGLTGRIGSTVLGIGSKVLGLAGGPLGIGASLLLSGLIAGIPALINHFKSQHTDPNQIPMEDFLHYASKDKAGGGQDLQQIYSLLGMS